MMINLRMMKIGTNCLQRIKLRSISIVKRLVFLRKLQLHNKLSFSWVYVKMSYNDLSTCVIRKLLNYSCSKNVLFYVSVIQRCSKHIKNSKPIIWTTCYTLYHVTQEAEGFLYIRLRSLFVRFPLSKFSCMLSIQYVAWKFELATQCTLCTTVQNF